MRLINCNNGLSQCITPLPMDASGKMTDYEFLCWIQANMKNLLNEMGELSAAWKALQDWVTNYFNNLDVQQEINHKIDAMVMDGTLSDIITPIIAEYQNPIFVGSISEMTDQNKTYVLTSNGHIYSWDGNEFTDTHVIYGVSGMEYTYRGQIVSNESGNYTISNYKMSGYYNSGNIGSATFTDFPDSLNPISSFLLENASYTATTETTFQTIKTNNGMAYRIISDQIYPWVVIVNELRNRIYRGRITELDSSSEYTIQEFNLNGYYVSGEVTGKTFTDYPANVTTTPFYLVNYVIEPKDSFLQVMYSEQGEFVSFRQVSDSIAYEWVTTQNLYKGTLPYNGTEPFTLSSITYTSIYKTGAISEHNVTDYPSSFNSAMIYTQAVDPNTMQFVIDIDGNIAYRFNYGNWYYFKNDTNYLKSGGYLLNSTGQTITLADINENIWYISGSLDGNTITDLPMDTGLFAFINIVPVNTRKLQLLFPINGSSGPFYRYIAEQVIYGWYPFFGSSGGEWSAIGDSITRGVYSNPGSGGVWDSTVSYAYQTNLFGVKKKFNNYGNDSMGFVHVGNTVSMNACDYIDSLDLSNSTLITVALGVNDWRYGDTIGSESSTVKDGTISGNCRYVIEQLCTKYPNASIVFITPMNNVLNENTTSATRYALDYENGSAGTLMDVYNIIKYWCDYYLIKCINLTTECGCVNLLNVESAFPDGVHPTPTIHKQLAREMAKRLEYV